MFLNRDQLKELTGKVYKTSQVKRLREMGIIHKVRADGYPVVWEGHIEKEFGASGESKNKRREPNWNAL